ncbi:helix-turn-helix transcriptional regulator [Rhodococcus sp. H36-A4]|uniref:helix-turn-helix domain-containing protein n=1 Tax=Rhodococcus sp. H36-A4 TaxID=3004353 RepID=UPI0022AE6FB4|nr:helix-turn-helix transcriptional regulator [Rhodococcus sp. H36-A4]MCZ4077288.1 helix-turn-helix transcriptional regulator [Rhodococcus sp. H36-A4]
MAAKQITLGPTGETVRENIARIRRERNLTLRSLSERLTEVGRPISNSSISQVETGSRRVDVDDLLAFAVALDVSPNMLLMPAHYDSNREIAVTGMAGVRAGLFWYFLDGMRSLTAQSLDFAVRSQPPFLQPQSVPARASESAPTDLRVARRMQTNGNDVDMSVSIGVGDLFEDEDDD